VWYKDGFSWFGEHKFKELAALLPQVVLSATCTAC